MTPERWKIIEDIYHAALERAPAARAAFLDEKCAGDRNIRHYVESLLAESAYVTNFMERPAMEVAAQSLALDEFDVRPPRQQRPGPAIVGQRYAILEEIGRGGMGIVYKVRDQQTNELVALKVLNPTIAADRQMIERFTNELRLARRVTHRNVCRIYDINQSNDITYISMELVQGESLRRVLNRLGALTVRKGVELIRQICEGLREAHGQGIIHRDLKPENIMLDEAGNVKIMDFGIARLASSGNSITVGISGTPAYMSPEQAEGRAMDQRSDIYSLGLVMYEVFTGTAAFSGDTPVAIALKQVRDVPPGPRSIEPSLPPQLENVILRCMEKDPGKRFTSLSEIESALALLTDLRTPVPAPAPRTNPRTGGGLFAETAYVVAPARARLLLLVIQAGYLFLYCATLYYVEPAARVLERDWGLATELAFRLLIFSTAVGIAGRIYLVSALVFDHPATGRQFSRLFPALLIVDALWAASPLLLADRIGIGLAFACVAGLAYLPFSQKTLVHNAYR